MHSTLCSYHKNRLLSKRVTLSKLCVYTVYAFDDRSFETFCSIKRAVSFTFKEIEHANATMVSYLNDNS